MGGVLDNAIMLLNLTCQKTFNLVYIKYEFKQHINENSFNKNNEGNYTLEQIFRGGNVAANIGNLYEQNLDEGWSQLEVYISVTLRK